MNQKIKRINRASGPGVQGWLKKVKPAPGAAPGPWVRRFAWTGNTAAVIIFCCLGFFFACTTDQSEKSDVFLIRVRNSQISVGEFKRYLEFSDEYLPEESTSIENRQEWLLRRLNQLTEELILKERAVELGISVSQEEVEKAVNDIKADYPDGTFDQALLENAVSFSIWRERLKNRMLMEKVITEELENKVEITPDDISAYYQAHHVDAPGKDAKEDQGVDQGPIDAVIVRQLRKTKAQDAYRDWIKTLQQAYQTEINWEEWKKLTLP
jgi:hypothetical protein